MRSRESQLPKPIVGADHQCAVNDHLRTVWDRDVWKDAGIGRRARGAAGPAARRAAQATALQACGLCAVAERAHR